MIHERKTHDLENQYNRDCRNHREKFNSLWPEIPGRHIYERCNLGHNHEKDNPDYKRYKKDLEEYNYSYPVKVFLNKKYARALNIIYSISNGRKYYEIEKSNKKAGRIRDIKRELEYFCKLFDLPFSIVNELILEERKIEETINLLSGY